MSERLHTHWVPETNPNPEHSTHGVPRCETTHAHSGSAPVVHAGDEFVWQNPEAHKEVTDARTKETHHIFVV